MVSGLLLTVPKSPGLFSAEISSLTTSTASPNYTVLLPHDVTLKTRGHISASFVQSTLAYSDKAKITLYECKQKSLVGFLFSKVSETEMRDIGVGSDLKYCLKVQSYRSF